MQKVQSVERNITGNVKINDGIGAEDTSVHIENIDHVQTAYNNANSGEYDGKIQSETLRLSAEKRL